MLARLIEETLKKAVLRMTDVGTSKKDLLKEDFDFNSLS
jgi:hypothetical protein